MAANAKLEPVPGPIPCFVAGSKGYVYDADGAVRLRRQHHLMGNLTGGVAQFKNQNEVNFLPLELSADEVTYAAQNGWVVLYPDTAAALKPFLVAAQPTQRRQAYASDPDYDAYYEYYQQFDERLGYIGRTLPLVGVKRRQHERQVARKQQQQQGNQQRDHSEEVWRAALRDKETAFVFPMTAAAAERLRAGASATGQQPVNASGATGSAPAGQGPPPPGQHQGQHQDGHQEGRQQTVQHPGVQWSYPSTPHERLRYAVFCDLHRQGFTMTGGSKFGADLLAYPGDPSLYHAQFTVRLVPPGTPLNPMLLKATARGSHAARKHLLLATFVEADAGVSADLPKVKYFSLAPESGFGSKA